MRLKIVDFSAIASLAKLTKLCQRDSIASEIVGYNFARIFI